MKNGKQPVVVGIGELLWDMLPDGKRAGGAPINFVYNAVQMGAKGYAISAVGKDLLGDEILDKLQASGIKGVIQRLDYPTGVVEVVLNKGIPTYTIVEDVAWDHLQVSDEAVAIIQQADAVCFGTLSSRHRDSATTLQKLLEYVPTEALRLFDVNLRSNYYSRSLIDELLQFADIFKINDDEIITLKAMYDKSKSDNDDFCRFLIDKYRLKYLIFTAGEKYSMIYSPQICSYLKTPQVCIRDTIGAGDAFAAAFVYNILCGKTLVEAHQTAVEVSAFVCTCDGAWPKYKKENSDE